MFKKLVTYELVDIRKWTDEVRPSFNKYDRRQGDYDDSLKKMVDIYTEGLVGISNQHVLYIANKVIEQEGERVYRFTRDQILEHKKNNRLILMISGSPIELVEAMAKKHNFDDHRGTIYVLIIMGAIIAMLFQCGIMKAKRKLSMNLLKNMI